MNDYVIYLILENITPESSTPSLKDLFDNALSYVIHWKEIGALLGLPSSELKIIETDYMYKTLPCCLAMVQKWLAMDPNASWDKWHKAVHRISGEKIKTGR